MFVVEKIKRAETKKQGYKCEYDFRIRCRIYPKQNIKDTIYVPEPNMTFTEAKREADSIRNDLEKNWRNKLNRILTVNQLIDEYLNFRSTQTSQKTQSNDKKRFERISERFGKVYLHELTSKMIDDWLDELTGRVGDTSSKYRCNFDILSYMKNKNISKGEFCRTTGIPQTTLNAMIAKKNVVYKNAKKLSDYLGKSINYCFESDAYIKPLSSKTILNHFSLLKSMLNQAVKWDYIQYNPCDKATKPKQQKNREMKCLDKNEIDILFNILDNESNISLKTIVKLLVTTGMRRSECLGLSWNDVDLVKQIITVHRTLQYTPEKGKYFGPTKTDSSVRVIPLPTSIIPVLKNYKEYQDGLKHTMGKKWCESDVVFTSFSYKHAGEPLNPDTVSEWFRKFMKANSDKLPYVRMHDLRHTYITQLIYAKTPIPTVSKFAGHSNITTTLNRYTHAIESVDKTGIEVVDKVF